MADAGFNRTTLTSPAIEPRRPGFGGLGALLLILALGAAAVAAYEIVKSVPLAPAAQQDQNLTKIQQQLSSIEARLDRLEKRRIAAVKSSAPGSEAQHSKNPEPVASARQTSEPTSSASAGAPPQTPAQSEIPVPTQTDRSAAVHLTEASSTDANASRDAWQATANQLTDMVGVVGSQQTEISKTQAEVGRLTAQSERFAIPFQLRRGSRPQRVGPVALELKNSDARRQRYSVSVFLDDKPVEFKDRAVDELVDFVVPGESAPLRFVATRISRESISGYMEVPSRGPSH